MTRYEPEHPGYDDADLDDLLERAMTGIGAKLDAGFDPAAGLADIYARSHADAPAPSPAAQAGPSSPVTGPAAGGSRLAEACGQIDVLRAVIAGAARSDRRTPLPGSAYLELAAGLLTELRAGLASRSMDRRRAEELLARVRQHLGRASLLLSLEGTSLDDLIRKAGAGPGVPVAELADITREMVLRLFSAPGDRSLAAL
jgi:hypothetical protein